MSCDSYFGAGWFLAWFCKATNSMRSSCKIRVSISDSSLAAEQLCPTKTEVLLNSQPEPSFTFQQFPMTAGSLATNLTYCSTSWVRITTPDETPDRRYRHA